MEWLERRLALANLSWTGAGNNALWSNMANWNPMQVPVASDNLTFNNGSNKASTQDIDFGDSAVAKLTLMGYTGALTLDKSTKVGQLSQDNGVIKGAGNLEVVASGKFDWKGGTLGSGGGGRVTIKPNAALEISGAVDKTLDARLFVNEGNALFGGSAKLVLKNGSIFDNKATFTVQGLGVKVDGSGDPTNEFRNESGATLEVEQSASFSVFFNELGGTVNISDATLLLDFASACSGTTFHINPSIGGALQLFSTEGRANQFSNCTADGTGVVLLSGGTMLIDNTVTFRRISQGGTSSFGGAGTLNVTRQMIIGGQATLDGGGTLRIAQNATLSYEAAGQSGPPANKNIRNDGTFTYNGPPTAVFSSLGSLTNTGTFTILAGTVDFQTSIDQTAGSTTLAGGALRSGGKITIGQGSRLSGTGSISTQELVNSGTITVGRPANPMGSLQVFGLIGVNGSGNYTQTGTGTLNLNIFDRPSTNRFNRLIITGKASLGGTLNVGLVGNPPLAAGDTFEIIGYGSLDANNKKFATTNIGGMAIYYGNTGVKVKKK